MSSFALLRNWLILFWSTIAGAVSSLWLAWRLMLVHRLAADVCFWVTLGWALGSGACLFFTLGAIDGFRSSVPTISGYSRCSELKMVLGGSIPIVASITLISLWGAHATLGAYNNLLVALVFVTTASVILITPSICYSILLSTYKATNARSGSAEPTRSSI